jgi:hypothetical protein
MRRLVLLAVLVLVVAPSAAAAPARVLDAGKSGFRVGPLAWSWNEHHRSPTLADFRRALGAWTSCVPQPRLVSVATVSWAGAGVTGFFTTLGPLPAGKTACSAPAGVYPDHVDAAGATWRTARGLHPQDTLARLHALYPAATRHGAVWWLVTRVRDPLWGTYGEVVATVRDGRVQLVRIAIHAEGD